MKSSEVKEQILSLAPGAPMYICGETYSDAQRWVEGMLQAADLMLGKYFGVKSLA